MQRHVVLSTKTMIIIVVTLILSVLAHVCVLVAYLKPLSFLQVNTDPKFPVPVDDAALTYVETHRFGLYSNDSDWNPILPDGHGLLYLPDHDAHYLLAHYHQLHCVRALRNYFLNINNMTQRSFSHASHCLIYLREMILCNVDVTLEPVTHMHNPLSTNGKISLAAGDPSVTHRCKDWSQVRDYMNSNYEMYKESYARKAAESLKNDSVGSSSSGHHS